MKKRVFSALLALVLTLSAVVLPASAAGSFSDVSDKKTAQNVEVLRLLGVVEGNGIGQFNPYAQLTRAEFCKMLVTLMGSSDVLRYKTMTIFPDVRASHWAARYVNYAVRGEKLLSGMPDGTFQPDRAISYGEAVTILMRLLRTDADAASGGIWPEGYIDLAKASGVSLPAARPFPARRRRSCSSMCSARRRRAAAPIRTVRHPQQQGSTTLQTVSRASA